jgi:hypothetical protein
MSPLTPTASQAPLPPKSILEPATVSFPKARQSRIKNFLFWFFVLEHIVIILIILSLAFFYVKTYAFSEFGELDEKARVFATQPAESVSASVFQRFSNQLPKTVSEAPLDIRADATEQEVSSFLSNLNLDHVAKMYISFKDGNKILVWILPQEVPQAFMMNLSFEYRNKTINLTTQNVHFGAIPLPVAWVGFIEESLENTVNNYIQSAESEYEISINDVRTEDSNIIIDMHFDDPQTAAQVFLE